MEGTVLPSPHHTHPMIDKLHKAYDMVTLQLWEHQAIGNSELGNPRLVPAGSGGSFPTVVERGGARYCLGNQVGSRGLAETKIQALNSQHRGGEGVRDLQGTLLGDVAEHCKEGRLAFPSSKATFQLDTRISKRGEKKIKDQIIPPRYRDGCQEVSKTIQ